MIILPVTQDQHDEFRRLLTCYYRDGADDATPQETLDAFISLLFDLCQKNVISGGIAYEGAPIGFVLWGRDTADFPFSNKPGFGTILEIGVTPSMRRMGLGKMLVEYAERALGRGRCYVCAYGPAERFWQKCGYVATGEIAQNGLRIYEKT